MRITGRAWIDDEVALLGKLPGLLFMTVCQEIPMSEITVRRTDHMHASELGRQDSQQRLLLMVLEKALHEMAHDLRSPLAGIRATSELLQEPEFRRSPDIETFLGNIDREINRLSQMVEGMTEALLIKLQAELKQQTRASDAVGTADNAAPHG